MITPAPPKRPASTAGLPLGAVVTDLEVDDQPHRLTAGTYGRGAWQLDLDRIELFSDGFEFTGAGCRATESAVTMTYRSAASTAYTPASTMIIPRRQ